jgi:RimJ/RimL family protein N-acetyltransferase
MLEGNRVKLRALRDDEFDVMHEAHHRLSPFDPPDPVKDQRLRERIARSGELVDGMLDLGIEVDGRLIGDVGARSGRSVMPPGVFEFGIEIYEDADRGRGYGAEATQLITDLLFEMFGAERVQASTALTNVAMRRVLERLGYREEGTLRGFMPAEDGGREDYAMYAVTRADWTTIAP